MHKTRLSIISDLADTEAESEDKETSPLQFQGMGKLHLLQLCKTL